MDKNICELFAGVGGFSLGFDRLNSDWSTVWFSQWEPGAKNQWAHDCYVSHFGDRVDLNGEFHTGDDISIVDKAFIPNHTLLVAGFPCQDYSIANSSNSIKGIEGKKGVLWWQVRDVIVAKNPPFCLLENVDRLLKSPSKQKGRDFGIILNCLNDLGYAVEWRVINAAQYGCSQRRRRTFIFAFRKDTKYAEKMFKLSFENIIYDSGIFSKAFPIDGVVEYRWGELPDTINKTSDIFSFGFENAGFMMNKKILTAKVLEKEEKAVTLGEVLQRNVDESFYIPEDKIEKWKYVKSYKRIKRKSSLGFDYIYSEGKMPFPDYLDKPARTILTGETSIDRSSHVVSDLDTEKLRILTPIEVERLQGFEDDWTNTGMPIKMRYFCMGNALVVPLITRVGKVINEIVENE